MAHCALLATLNVITLGLFSGSILPSWILILSLCSQVTKFLVSPQNGGGGCVSHAFPDIVFLYEFNVSYLFQKILSFIRLSDPFTTCYTCTIFAMM